MASRSLFPSLIKGINRIKNRPPDRVNYSTLNEMKMGPGKQIGNEIRQKYGKCKIFRNYVKFKNKAKHTSDTKILNRLGNKNKNK